jgi:ABC-type antimicrobial peptide transport system permease subunit
VYTAPSATLVIRASRDPSGVILPVRAALREVDRAVPLTSVALMEEVIAESLAQQRFSATLLSVFSVGALALAVFGLYGVISFGVARRAREFGVRLALGADPGLVQWMVLREGLTLALIGVGVGLAMAAGFSRVLSGLVYRASTTDLVTLAGVTILLTGVTLAAALVPARRAMQVDPAVVLREE